MKVGQIVRITKFGSWHTGLNACTGEIWARVVELPSRHDDNYVCDIELIAGTGDAPEYVGVIGWAPYVWPLDRTDRFEKVPPSKVPDWVWVQQAQRELSK